MRRRSWTVDEAIGCHRVAARRGDPPAIPKNGDFDIPAEAGRLAVEHATCYLGHESGSVQFQLGRIPYVIGRGRGHALVTNAA